MNKFECAGCPMLDHIGRCWAAGQMVEHLKKCPPVIVREGKEDIRRFGARKPKEKYFRLGVRI